jgi:hypothetical protein
MEKVEAKLAKIVAVWSGRQLARAAQSIGGLSPQRRVRPV